MIGRLDRWNPPVNANSGNTRISGLNSSIPQPPPSPPTASTPSLSLPFLLVPRFSNSSARRMFPSTSPSFGANWSVAILMPLRCCCFCCWLSRWQRRRRWWQGCILQGSCSDHADDWGNSPDSVHFFLFCVPLSRHSWFGLEVRVWFWPVAVVAGVIREIAHLVRRQTEMRRGPDRDGDRDRDLEGKGEEEERRGCGRVMIIIVGVRWRIIFTD